MAFAEHEDPQRLRRKRRGKLLGVAGLVLLFGSALSFRLVPQELTYIILGLLAAAAGIMVVSYLMVR